MNKIDDIVREFLIKIPPTSGGGLRKEEGWVIYYKDKTLLVCDDEDNPLAPVGLIILAQGLLEIRAMTHDELRSVFNDLIATS